MLGGLVAAASTVPLVARFTPWPSALLIRWAFDKGGRDANDALARHVPAGILETLDEPYAATSPDARLDVFAPAGTAAGQRFPAVVWVHGGAWLSGDKDQVRNYLKILAAQGFTVIGVNYSISPGCHYPVPVRQVNAALAHVRNHAERLHVDVSRIVLAGDSAGSHIAAQVANLTTSPAYAVDVGIEPSLEASQLVGTVLYCGAYDLDLAAGASGFGGWFIDTALWSYSGSKDYADDPTFRAASVARHLTPRFPPSFISAGNADPLLAHSEGLIAKLAALGVPTDAVMFPADRSPALGHEYQFDLDSDAGREALSRSVAFLHRVSRNGAGRNGVSRNGVGRNGVGRGS